MCKVAGFGHLLHFFIETVVSKILCMRDRWHPPHGLFPPGITSIQFYSRPPECQATQFLTVAPKAKLLLWMWLRMMIGVVQKPST